MSDDTNNRIISDATPIRIGLIITILGIFLGAFGGSVWWASSTTAKLDSILSFQKTTDSVLVELKAKDMAIDKDMGDVKTLSNKEISEIKLKIALIEVDLKNLKEKSVAVIKE